MPDRKLIVFGRALADLVIGDEQLVSCDLEVVGISDTAGFSANDADFVLLDGSIDNPGLMAQIQFIRTRAPQCRILLNLTGTMQETVEYLQAGVSGLLKPPLSAEGLKLILDHVHSGQLYLDPAIAQILAMRQIKKLLQPFNTLTSREFDVFCMLAEGCSLKSIAEHLGVSCKTVSNCQSQIKLKMGLVTPEALLEFAKSNGLVEREKL